MKIKVVLDTSYLLPFFGLRVKELSDEMITQLIIVFKKIEVFYPILMIPELIAKISKELIRRKIQINESIIGAFESLLSKVDIQLIEPQVNHIVKAIEIRTRGHRDIFDCIAYATALEENAKLLTIDIEFIQFLEANEYDTSIIWDHNKLLKEITSK